MDNGEPELDIISNPKDIQMAETSPEGTWVLLEGWQALELVFTPLGDDFREKWKSPFPGFLLVAVFIELRAPPTCLIADSGSSAKLKQRLMMPCSTLWFDRRNWDLDLVVVKFPWVLFKDQVRCLWGTCARDVTGQEPSTYDEGPSWSKCKEKPGYEMKVEELQRGNQSIALGLLWYGDSTSQFLLSPGSQSDAPSEPMLLCSILILGWGSLFMDTRCRPRDSPAACISPGKSLAIMIRAGKWGLAAVFLGWC